MAFSIAAGNDLPAADGVVQISWQANPETDLAGYRLQYRTTSTSYGAPIDVGNVTSYELKDLDPGQTYYFVVYAYDQAGNISLPSSEVSARPTSSTPGSPFVTSALEDATDSIYILRAARHRIEVRGGNFLSGATVDLGADVAEQPAVIGDAASLTSVVDVSATAALGPRALTVTNADGSAGGMAAALTVVRNADMSGDCLVDSLDLNRIARAWNSTAGETRYSAPADLDGDDYVGPEDIAVFAEYFGQRLLACAQ